MTRNLIAAAPAVFAVITLVFGVRGWSESLSGQYSGLELIEQALFLTVKAFTFSDEYNALSAQTCYPELRIARWTGLAATMGALVQIGYALLQKQLKEVQAAFRRGHVVVLGDHVFARRVSEALSAARRQVTHHASADEDDWDGVLTVRRPASLKHRIMRLSLADSARIMVAESTDAETAQTALILSRDCPDTPVFAFIKQPWLAERLNHVVDIAGAGDVQSDRLTVVSEAASAARAVIARHPPYIASDGALRPRLHILIAGFGALGEALVVEILNTCLISEGPGAVSVTVIDPDAVSRAAGFAARHGDLSDVLDIAFIACRADALDAEGVEVLRRRTAERPLNAAYVAPGETASPLVSALALREVGEREDLFDCPIFVRARRGAGLAEAPAHFDYEPRQLIAFARWDEVIEASGLLDDDPDALARSFHETYRRAGSSAAADRPWEQLSEKYRVSNRRAVAHIPAVLAAAGFDIRAWAIARSLSPIARPDVHSGETLFRGDDELALLARLEHARWVIDRRLEGWRPGQETDRAARVHANLKSYDALDAASQLNNVRFVEAVADWMGAADEGLSRRCDAE
jgi:hypothetical protein